MEPESISIEMIDISPEELEILRREDEMRKESRDRAMRELAEAIEAKFVDRANNRTSKETEWIDSLELYLGSLASGAKVVTDYNNPMGQNISKKRSKEINIVARKCDIAIAQGHMRQFAGGDKNWDIFPMRDQTSGMTPEQASFTAEKLEETIYKQLTNCKYGHQARSAYKDRVIIGTGILKGPINRLKVRKRYQIDQATGIAVPVLTSNEEPSIIRVNPWMFYPDDTVQSIDEADDAIESHPMGKCDLTKLLQRKDFITDSIIALLREEPRSYIGESNNMFANFSNNDELYKDKYTVLEYHGPITKDELGTLGIDPAYETPLEHYYGEVWVCQGKILRIELSNVEGTYEVPYGVSVWQEDPGSIFGIGIPLLMRDNQDVVNVAWQMVLDNASLSSGPQVVVDKNIIRPQNGTWEVEPWKIWLLDQFGADARAAFQYINPQNSSEQLMGVLQAARSFAEEESGVPLLAQGLQSPQAADASATTTAIYNTNSTTILDFMSETWDDEITQKCIEWMYAWNMQYNPDPSIKGDFEIDVRSSTELRRGELQAKNLEKLNVLSAQDPVMGQIVNRQNSVKAWIGTMQLPDRNIVKSDEQIAQEQQQAQENQQPDPAILDLQIKQQKLQLEAEKLQFEREEAQKRYEMDYQEKMVNSQIRLKEVEGRVLAAQLEYDTAMAQLASKSETDRAKILSELEARNMDNETKKFLAGQDQAIKARSQALKEVEAEQAIKTGKGW